MKKPDWVSVPKELLALVLDQAESDNSDVEYERACNASERMEYARMRERIYELRNVAGIEE